MYRFLAHAIAITAASAGTPLHLPRVGGRIVAVHIIEVQCRKPGLPGNDIGILVVGHRDGWCRPLPEGDELNPFLGLPHEGGGQDSQQKANRFMGVSHKTTLESRSGCAPRMFCPCNKSGPSRLLHGGPCGPWITCIMSRHPLFSLPCAVLCIGILSIAYLVGKNSHRIFRSSASDIEVTGSTSMDFESDLAVWQGEFTRTAQDLKEVYALMKTDKDIVRVSCFNKASPRRLRLPRHRHQPEIQVGPPIQRRGRPRPPRAGLRRLQAHPRFQGDLE